MNNSSNDSEAAWLQTTLLELLSAPYISICGLLGTRMGPGPIDLFSTKFNKMFTADVKAVVAGERVNREGLKERLLALQRHCGDPDRIKYSSHVKEEDTITEDGQSEVYVSFAGVDKDLGDYEVSVAANVVIEESRRKISSLKLQGKPELFTISTM